MKTQVTKTSIEAYHTHPAKGEQCLKVAEFCERETKAGRLVWIGKIADHFLVAGNKDLGQKSTASARLADIKERGVILNGRKYRLEFVREERPQGGRCKVEMWALILDQPKEATQLLMF
jgi:hypothetical protein